jgi:hypothetical protein
MKDNALYLEADEDITSAIDKLTKSSASAVQIVVPKRSTMLQSIINLKLLKKAAEAHGKELVLVTGDRIATDLAARVGLAVAASIGAKPVLSEAEMPAELKDTDEIIEEDDDAAPPAPPAETKPPKSKPPFLKHKEVSDGPPATPEDDAPDAPDPATSAPGAAAAAIAEKPGIKAKKAPKVPNWGRLQRRALWIGTAVILIGGYTLGMYFLTSAKVVLYANGTKSSIDTTFTVDPSLKTTDQAKGVLAGQLVTVSKDLTGPFTPTGQKDAGTKASGTMTVYNSYDTSTHTLVSGTRFQAPDGKIFLSTQDVDVPGASIGLSGGQITMNPGQAQVNVQAQNNGDGYNEAAADYTIPGYSGTMQQKIYAKGGAMAGGTSKQVTVVQQSDVDGAKQDLLDKDKDASARDLSGRVPTGYTAITASQTSAVSNVNPSPAVNAEGSTGNLQLHVAYTVLAVKSSEYKALIESKEASQLGSDNQVYDNGISGAQITANGDKDSATNRQSFHFTTDAFGGPKLDTAAIARQLAGKRFGDAQDAATRTPGVTKTDIALTPPWATNLPSRSSAVHVTIKVANQ